MNEPEYYQDDIEPLSNLDAENSVLGSILQEPDLMDECYLQPDDFYNDRNRLIMNFLRYLEEIDEPIDIVVIIKVAGKDSAKLGGVSYLSDLAGSVPSTSNFNSYQGIVKELSIKRRTTNVLKNKLQKAVADGSSKEYIAEIITDLEEVSEGSIQVQDVVKMSSVLNGYEEVLTDRRKQKGMTGIKTVSKKLDRMSGGHQDGDLIVVAARPSIGKTAFVINDMIGATKKSEDLIENHTAALIFSLEMNNEKVAERAICAIGNINSDKMRSGRFNEEDWERFFMARKSLEAMSIYIDDTPAMTLQDIGAKVKQLKKHHEKLIVYIDYLQLVSPGKRGLKGHEAVAYVSRGLKNIARKNNCPVVAISSVSRKCEERNDKRPMMSDLRESGDIEFSADVIAFLYRDDYYNAQTERKNIIEIIIAKGRNIGTGTVEMIYNRTTSRFIDFEKNVKASE